MSERRGTSSKFTHGDALGSTRGLTDSGQAATDALRFDAFGMTTGRTGTTPTPFGFVGSSQYQTDADTGLMLLGHRYYDASVGRFLTSDPAKAGDNWYAYCENNPLKRVDPTGYFWSFIVAILALAVLEGCGNSSDGGVDFPTGGSGDSGGGFDFGGSDDSDGGFFGSNDFGGSHNPPVLSPGTPIYKGGTGEIPGPGQEFSGQVGPPEVAGPHLPNGQMNPVGTVGDIEKGGGSVTSQPEPYRPDYPQFLNPGHVNVTLGDGYNPPGSLPPGLVDNPVPTKSRIPVQIKSGIYGR